MQELHKQVIQPQENSAAADHGASAIAKAMPAVTTPAPASLSSPGTEEIGDTGTPARFIPKQAKQAPLQLRHRNYPSVHAFKPVQQMKNDTGLPDNLKAGVESLSGTNLSDVKVQYNSAAPAQFNAAAYAQGNDIHIAPGQEQHLPHEAWHVAQQKQGRVQPTAQLKDADINDDSALENEADIMGAKALSISPESFAAGESVQRKNTSDGFSGFSAPGVSQLTELQNINREISNHESGSQSTKVAQLAGKFLVDDGQTENKGQLAKSAFLSRLRSEIQAVAREILEPVGLAQANCPDLNYWITFYETKDAAYIEQAVAHYAPMTADANSPEDYISGISEKVKERLIAHVETGQVTADPAEVPADIEEQRPEPPGSTLQMKESPIQFGHAKTTTKTTVKYKFPMTKTGRRQEADAMPVERLYAKVQAIRAIGDQEEKCREYIKLFETYKGVGDAFGGALSTFTTRKGRDENYAKYGYCSDVQNLVMGALFGITNDKNVPDGHDRLAAAESVPRPEKNILSNTTVNDIKGNMKGRGKVIPFSSAGIGGGGHCFTIVTSSKKTKPVDETKETVSGAGSEVLYYLFQAWVNIQDILNTKYTRVFTEEEFDTFLTVITTTADNDYIADARAGTSFSYEIFDRP